MPGSAGPIGSARPLETIAVPATVQAVLAARIDRLAAGGQAPAPGRAVIGKDVPFALLQAIAELPEEELRRGLAPPAGRRVPLRDAASSPISSTPSSTPSPTRWPTASLLQERRRALHARIVEAIEALYPDRLAEHVERLAHHALRGEVWDKAVAYLRQAGAKARRALGVPGGGRVLRAGAGRARGISRRAATRSSRPSTSGSTSAMRSCPSEQSGRPLDHLREAETLATALGDRRRLARLAIHLMSYFWGQAGYDGAIEWAQRAVALAAELGDPVLEGTAPYYLGRVYDSLGDYGTAIPLLERSVALLEQPATAEGRGMMSYSLPSVLARTFLTWSLAERGAFPQAVACGEEAVRLATAADHAESVLSASAGLGGALSRKGDIDRAIPTLERAVALGDAIQVPLLFPFLAMSLGAAYVLAGRTAEAIAPLEKAWAQTVAMPFKTIQSKVAAHLGERRISGRDAWARPWISRRRRWSSPASTRSGGTRRGASARSERSRSPRSLPTPPGPRARFDRRASWPASSGCAPWWPTVTWVWSLPAHERPGARRGAPDAGPGCVHRNGHGPLGGPGENGARRQRLTGPQGSSDARRPRQVGRVPGARRAGDVPSLTRKGWDVVRCRALAEILDKKIVELDGIEPLETALAASHRP